VGEEHSYWTVLAVINVNSYDYRLLFCNANTNLPLIMEFQNLTAPHEYYYYY